MNLLIARARFFLVMALLVAIMAGLAWMQDRRSPEIRGQARVVDGDSLVVAGTEIRLFGIDAPEYRQTCIRSGEPWACGSEAARALRAAIAGREIVCRAREEDRYGRTVAMCHADQLDLSAAMVKGGYAVAYGGYAGDEREARDARRGIWSSSFDRPATWRARHPRPQRGD